MTDLHARIHRAHVHAAEQVVMDDLRRRGLAEPDETIEYSKREAVAREVLRAIGTGYELPMDQSLCEMAENVFNPSPRAIKAVEIADRIIEIMQSKRRTWPSQPAVEPNHIS